MGHYVVFVFIWLTSVSSGASVLLWFFLGKKAMAKLNSVLKSRDIILQTKVHTVEAMFCFVLFCFVFSPGVMYKCENWDIKKAECQRIDTFELWCWRRLLRVPWTARRSNQSILKEINLEYPLQTLLLKLKLQNSGHLIWRANLLEVKIKKPWCWHIELSLTYF